MREIQASEITQVIAQMCKRANYQLPDDIKDCLLQAYQKESYPIAKETLGVLKENLELASQTKRPICQDTGMACIFVEIGQDVHVNGHLTDAIHEGVRQGYQEGYLRKSIVRDPVLERVNTQDNTPANIHYDIVPGEKLKLTVAPKGFGSENMSRIKMMKPSDGIEGVKCFILETVEEAGPNPCPPIVIGVGIGGSFDTVGLLAKKAMLENAKAHHPDPRYAAIEKEMLEKVNALGIGPAGFGGGTTALALHIQTAPTHIAGMPVAVAICCHVARKMEVEL